MFGECCFDVGDVKITMGTGTFMNINTGRKPHTSVAGKVKYMHIKIIMSKLVHIGPLQVCVSSPQVCILWWVGRLAQRWYIWLRAMQQTLAPPSNGRRSWVSDKVYTVALVMTSFSSYLYFPGNIVTRRCFLVS